MPGTAKTPLPGLTGRAAAGPRCTRPIPGPALQQSSTGRSSRVEPPNRNRPLDVDTGQLAHREAVEGADGPRPSVKSALCHMRFTYGTRQRFGSLGGRFFPNSPHTEIRAAKPE